MPREELACLLLVPEMLRAAVDCLNDDHSYRVASLSARLARAGGLDPHLGAMAGFLHDVGKLAVPTQVLHKPGPLTCAERQALRRHVIEGVRIIEVVWPEVPTEVVVAVAQHHERLDGTGYPEGLPLVDELGAVVAVADVYDALASDRAYRPGYPVGEAYRLTCEQALPGWLLMALKQEVGVGLALAR